ncbi:type IV conjugative transfer system coupling protein TraD [Grimontella sp. AG753]|nr:type IV conjugative transfer system coupling protein TraD [Grimontella sp. AG753]
MQDKVKEKGHISSLNSGGQVLMHFLRMLTQTVKHYLKIVFAFFCIITSLITYQITDKTDWYMGLKYGYSYTLFKVIGLKKGKTTLTLPNGQTVTVLDSQIVSSQTMQNHANTLISNLIKSLLISTVLALIGACYLYRLIVKKGKEVAKDEFRRGAQVQPVEVLIERAKDRIKEDGRPSRISISGVPLVRYQENSGIVMLGSPGTGKSTLLRDVMRQLRSQCRKAVLYDISGEFVKYFYRPETDVILNVFDTRSHSWDFWAEGKNPVMYDRMAKAAIPSPSSGGDPFWTEAPRLLFSALLERLGERFDVPSVEHLMNIILRMSNEKIADVVATTDARTVMNLDLDKLAGSVRAIITAFTRNFKYLSLPTGPRFSFKEWARDEDSEAWVFITVRDDMKDTLKPLITMMIESALSSILTLPPSLDRLIGVELDELGTLHEIPTLPDFMSTCRKYGGFPLLGFQSNAQTESVFGEKKAQILMDSIGALAAFRINGVKGASWSAEQLGDQETEKTSENTSYGANDVRDATSYNRADKEQNVIMKSQIQELLDNTCYLRLGRGLPISKIKFPFDNMKERHAGIVESEILSNTSFMAELARNNEISPEHIANTVIKNIAKEKREPQKFKTTTTDNSNAGKTQEEVIDEVINEEVPTTVRDSILKNEPTNPVAQAMSSLKNKASINPVAEAMRKKTASDSEGQSEEGDFSELQAYDRMNSDLISQYGDFQVNEKSDVEAIHNRKSDERYIDQHDFPGGM